MMTARQLRRSIALTLATSACLMTLQNATAADAAPPAGRPGSQYPANQPPLKPTPFVALPLGTIKANGWLLKQLELQRDGLTGHAEEQLDEIKSTSAWLGGDGENWEKSPYYVKGLIPLAYTLDDKTLEKKAQKWVEWALASQRADGFYGPANNDDWWPRMVSNYFLRDYYDATGDKRVLPLLTNYYRFMLKNLPGRPLRDWGRSRAGDDMDTAIWLYNRTKEPFLLELVDLLRKQAFDWPTIMHQNTFQSFRGDYQPKHNVNVPQAIKMPAVSWQRTGDATERSAVAAGEENLMRENGQSVGMQAGTEFLSGRSPTQGIEFCSIVEQMLSDETIVRIFGEGRYADRLERIAYNALPAAWNRDLTGLQYYTLDNFVIAKNGGHGYGQDYHNGLLPGPRSGFPCCCFNVHQGWPKLVQNSWAATPDGGLAPMVYAPTTVTAKVTGGRTVTIIEETNYPFDGTVRFTIKTAATAAPRTGPAARDSADEGGAAGDAANGASAGAVQFPLELRTPQWCEGAKLRVAGAAVAAPKAGEFMKIDRKWADGDVVELTLPMAIRVEPGVNGSAHVVRGPLVYTLRIGEDKQPVNQPTPRYAEWAISPTSPWNYALQVDPKNPGKSIELLKDDTAPGQTPSQQAAGDSTAGASTASGANPFDKDNAPVKLSATARKLPGWGLAWNGVLAMDPPISPVQSNQPLEKVTLLPYGAQDLRLTDFPVLGSPTAKRGKPMAINFDDNDASAFLWYGGSWWAHEGALRTTPTGGEPGFKALLEGQIYTDLELWADVTPPKSGDAGVIFRVSKPAIGADAYLGYYAGISASGNRVELGYADGTGWNPLKAVDHDIPADKPTRLSITAKGKRIEVRIGDGKQPVISIEDDRYTTGQAGVRMYTVDRDQSYSAFDNVEVTPSK